jgi:hypothetical protein
VNTSANTVTGSFHSGKNGTLEIDVPLAHVGGPKKGASLGAAGGQTDESNPAHRADRRYGLDHQGVHPGREELPRKVAAGTHFA